MEPNIPDRYLSTAESSRILGIGLTKLFGLLKNGEIAARKIGSRTLIPESEISAFQSRLPAARNSGGLC